MKDARERQVGRRQPRDSIPRRPVLLAAAPKRSPPEFRDVEAKRVQALGIGRYRMVREVPAHHLGQPPPLLWDRFMHTPLKFRFEGTQLGAHPVTARLAVKQEEAAAGPPTDVREPQKVERLRFAKTAFFAIVGRMATKLDQTRLVRVQR